MALTILERPIGVVLGTCVDANINQDYNGFATVNNAGHNLQDNDWVYISCDVESYNGFYQVDVINTGEFTPRQYDGTYLPYVVDADITYCPGIQPHGVSCVHLPITYRISNNKYPTNSVDTARTITSLANNSGFAQVGLSGTLGTFEDLQFVKISGAPDSTLDGIYQVIDKLSTSSVILNIDYTTVTNATLLGASIQIYYGNYNVVVRVYAGINSGHTWASEKPYELAATLELIPDDNNQVFFSINEILKAYIKTENNLLLPSLPNNIDGWTNFYISTAEAYDTSNGYTVSTLETGFTSDQSTFEGTAVNAELEFKNTHSGYLSDYINPIRWLTLFDELTVYLAQYFDISFINIISNGTLGYRVKNYINDVLQSTVDYDLTPTIPQPQEGVVRFKPQFNSTSDKIKVALLFTAISEQPSNNTFTSTLSPWTNTRTGTAWVSNANQARVTLLAGTQSQYLKAYNYPLYPNVTYDILIPITASFTDPAVEFRIYGIVPGDTVTPATLLASSPLTLSPASITFQVTPGKFFQSFALVVDNASGSTTIVDADSVTISVSTTSIISDELTININQECVQQEINLQWINNLCGFDPWAFTAQSEHAIDITEATETKKNIFPNWPKSYGDKADTIRKQVMRKSMIKKFIVSQHLTQNQADAIAYIKSSPLVQIVNSRQDRRTVTVDTDSFVKYIDGDKLYNISFNITYTDDIPSQK